MKSNLKWLALVGVAYSSASLAQSQELGLLSKERSEKGYLKRDRVLVGSMMSVAPSQLHEIYGARFDAGVEYDTSRYQSGETDARITTPGLTFGAAVGGDILVLGLAGKYKETAVSLENSTAEESSRITKIQPLAAITIKDNVTIGANYDISRVETTQDMPGYSADHSLPYERLTASVAYHNPKMEFGLMYAGAATASSTDKDIAATNAAFGLATRPDAANTRDLYIPAHFGMYARGNLTDSFSLQGTLAHVEYDAEEEGAVDLFSKYKKDDRLAGQLQGIYWFPQRSRIATTMSYTGATFSPIGTDDNGLGYRLANRYGLTVDMAAKVADKTYAGGFVGYHQGERDEFVNNVTYQAEEQFLRVGANFSKTF